MGVGVDRDQDPLQGGPAAVDPVQIEPAGIGVQLENLPVLPRGLDDPAQINRVALAAQEDPFTVPVNWLATPARLPLRSAIEGTAINPVSIPCEVPVYW